jgi:hypothetical protein
MPDITLHLHRITAVVVAPYTGPNVENGPFAVVRLDEGRADTRVHVAPDGVVRAREVASAINAAADAVEDAVRRSRPVPIASLAPDESDIERAMRRPVLDYPTDPAA